MRRAKIMLAYMFALRSYLRHGTSLIIHTRSRRRSCSRYRRLGSKRFKQMFAHLVDSDFRNAAALASSEWIATPRSYDVFKTGRIGSATAASLRNVAGVNFDCQFCCQLHHPKSL